MIIILTINSTLSLHQPLWFTDIITSPFITEVPQPIYDRHSVSTYSVVYALFLSRLSQPWLVLPSRCHASSLKSRGTAGCFWRTLHHLSQSLQQKHITAQVNDNPQPGYTSVYGASSTFDVWVPIDVWIPSAWHWPVGSVAC